MFIDTHSWDETVRTPGPGHPLRVEAHRKSIPSGLLRRVVWYCIEPYTQSVATELYEITGELRFYLRQNLISTLYVASGSATSGTTKPNLNPTGFGSDFPALTLQDVQYASTHFKSSAQIPPWSFVIDADEIALFLDTIYAPSSYAETRLKTGFRCLTLIT